MYPELKKKYDWIKRELENNEWVSFHNEKFDFRIIVSIDDVKLGDNYLIYDNGELFDLISDITLYSTRMSAGKPASTKEIELGVEDEYPLYL